MGAPNAALDSLTGVPGVAAITEHDTPADAVMRSTRPVTQSSTARGAFPYKRVVGDQEPFQVIGQLALEAGCGVTGQIGEAQCRLFAAKPLADFIVHWLSAHFGFR